MKRNIEQEIEHKRDLLNKRLLVNIAEDNRNDLETLKLSKELDELIVNYIKNSQNKNIV